jgi:hypothetical protein
MNDLTQKYDELKEATRAAKENFERTQDKADFSAWRKLAAEQYKLHDEILIARGVLLRGHTHPELVDSFLRSVLANELMVLRRSMRSIGETLNSDSVSGIRTGLDTFARRLQDINKRGLEAVYKQNYEAR